MTMKSDWSFKPSGQNSQNWESICPANEYRVTDPSAIPTGIIPPALLKKCDSVVVMATGLNNGVTAYTVNMNRVDYNAGAIDQQTFSIGFQNGQPLSSACLTHHPNWHNRSTPFLPDFVQYIKISGHGHCYPISELPSKPSGTLIELDIQSQKEALKVSVEPFIKRAT